MITSQQINWIAGLLEGEGTFRIGSSPSIRIGMTDLDIIERFRIITKTTDYKVMTGPSKPGWKPAYYTAMYGNLAIQWMMTIYPLMGIRRKEKMRDVIEKWKKGEYAEIYTIRNKKYNSFEYKAGRKGIKAVMAAKGVTKEEAIRMIDEWFDPVKENEDAH